MTLEELRETVPKHVQKHITQSVVDTMNHLEAEDGEDFAEHYKQNFINMSSILKSSDWTVKDYTAAVKFVSWQLLEIPDIDCYKMTFPDRYDRLMTKWTAEGLSEADVRGRKISSFVSAYKSNPLVVKIMEQALVPPRILNAHMFQDALNVQMQLAFGANSEMVRTTAANSILTHLKNPETTKIQMEVGIKGQDELQALRNEMQRLAGTQQVGIESGSNTTLEIAESTIMFEDAIEGEIE